MAQTNIKYIKMTIMIIGLMVFAVAIVLINQQIINEIEDAQTGLEQPLPAQHLVPQENTRSTVSLPPPPQATTAGKAGAKTSQVAAKPTVDKQRDKNKKTVYELPLRDTILVQ